MTQIASFEVRGIHALTDAQAAALAKKLHGRRIGGVLLSGKARGVLRISNRVKEYIPELDQWLGRTAHTLTSPRLRAVLEDRWIAKCIIPE